MGQPDSEILLKLIRLNTRCPAAVQRIYRIAVGSPDCMAKLRTLETRAEDGIAADDASPLADPELAHLAETKPEVNAILRRAPMLCEVEPPVLAVLASIADAEPGYRGVPVTKDGPFGYIATLVTDEDGTTTSDWLTRTFTLRLIELSERLPALLAALRSLSGRDDYRDIVNEFDEWLDLPTPPGTAGEDLSLLLGAWQTAPGSPVDRSILYGLPRVSQIPVELIRAFPVGHPQAGDQPSSAVGIDALMEKAEQVDKVLAGMHASGPEMGRAIQLRLDAALDLLARRRFVKTQMLEFGWPKLLSCVRAPGGQRRLRELERAVLEPSRRAALGGRWKEFLEDERLVDFLSMPPYFKGTAATELAGLEFESSDDATANDAAAGPEATVSLDDELAEFGNYADVHFMLWAPDQELPDVRPDGSKDPTGAVVRARFALSVRDMRKETGIAVPAPRIRELLKGLSYA